MIDRLGRELSKGDLILHCDTSGLYFGIIVEDRDTFIRYVLLQGSEYMDLIYTVKARHRVIKIEQTVDVMNNQLVDCRGFPEKCTIAEAVQYTMYEYNKRSK